MRYFRFFSAALCLIFLFGCFQTDTVIRLKPDGSGVIEQTFLLSNTFLESFQELSKGFVDDDDKTKSEAKIEKEDPVQGMIKDARSKENQFGPGVKFVSAIPMKTETMSGYKAIYSFKDINTLKVNQNPGNKAEKLGAGKENPTEEENILFKFVKKGSTSTLTMMMPKPKAGKEEKEKNEDKVPKAEVQKKGEEDPKAAEMAMKILKDMGIRIALEINGTILKTNATYRKNSELTILDLNFGKFIENKDQFEKLTAANPKTVQEIKELVKGIEGLKIETANPIVVEFK